MRKVLLNNRRNFHFFAIALCFFSWVPLLYTQLFTLINLDESNFPLIRSQIILSDDQGQSIRSIVPSDFRIVENGIPRTVVQAECKPIDERRAIQVVLVADRSMSMAAPTIDGSMTRIELLKRAMEEFVDAVEFVGRTEIAITAFDAEAYLVSNFRSDPVPLRSAIMTITSSNQVGTNYEKAFLDPAYGAIPTLESAPNPDNNRRAIIFFTDGQPIPPSSFNFDVVQEIITRAQFANIEIYPITLDLKMHPDLRRIAEETGGMAFDELQTVEEVAAIYRLIADRLQGVEACEISWVSDVGCGASSRYRIVEAEYLPLGLRTTTAYNAPASSVAQLDASGYVVGFGNPEPGTSVVQSLTLTARNADFTVQNVQFTGVGVGFSIVDWGGSPPPFTIPDGSSRTIQIQFVGQPNQSFQIQTLELQTEPCPIEAITLWGGRPGQQEAPVQVVSPAGGEIFASCDSVPIRWSGIPLYHPVNIYYSDDGGTTWKLIASDVVGYRYMWVPPAPGNRYLVKVVAKPNTPIWQWVVSGEKSQQERILSVSSNLLGYVAAVGSYEGQKIQFADSVEVESGTRFLLLLDSLSNPLDAVSLPAQAKQVVVNDQGYVFVLTDTELLQYQIDTDTLLFRWRRSYINPDLRDTLQKIALDPQGRCYILRTSLELQPGNQQLWRSYIERVNLAGSVVQRLTVPDVRATQFAVDIFGNVILTGFSYQNTVIPKGTFVAKLSPTASLLWHYILNSGIVTTELATDVSGNFYHAGYFSGMGQFPGEQISSYGNFDGFLIAYAADGQPLWFHHFYAIGDSREQLLDLVVNRSGQIFVAGVFQNRTLYLDGNVFLRKEQSTTDRESFVAAFNDQGTLIWRLMNSGTNDDQIVEISPDPQFGVYGGGWFYSSSFQCYPFTLKNRGDADFFIGHIIPLPGGEDQSDSVFAAEAPQLRIASQRVDFGMVPVGDAKIVWDTLCNNGTLPLELVLSITQLNYQDFEVLATDTIVIMPGECIPIKLLFQPIRDGTRRSFLDIASNCLGIVSVELIGEGGTPCNVTVLDISEPLYVAANKDTVFTVEQAVCNSNDYTLDGSVTIAGPGAIYYTLLSPTVFQLAPGECYTATIQLQAPGDPGPLPTAWLEYSFSLDCGDMVTRIAAVVIPNPPKLEAQVPSTVTLLCVDSVEVFSILVQNHGQEDLLIQSIQIVVPNVVANVLTPLPRQIPSGKADTITVAVYGQSAGNHVGEIQILSNDPDQPVYTVPVLFSVQDISIQLSTQIVSLGTVLLDQFPYSQTVQLTNTSQTEIVVAPVQSGNVSVQPPGGNSVLLQPGESVDLEITVQYPGIGDFSYTVVLNLSPRCSDVLLRVEGTVVQPQIHVAAPTMAIAPTQRAVSYPLQIQQLYPQNFSIDRSLQLRIVLNPQVFYVYQVRGAEILQKTISFDSQELLVQIGLQNAGNGFTIELIGDAILGNALSTPVLLDFSPADSVVYQLSSEQGLIALTDICREGGERLILSSSSEGAKIRSVTVQGTSIHISANAGEIGLHCIEIYNVLGQRIASECIEIRSLDVGNSVWEVDFAKSQFTDGLYIVVFRSPTQEDIYKFMMQK